MNDDRDRGKWVPVALWFVVAVMFSVLLLALVAGNLGKA